MFEKLIKALAGNKELVKKGAAAAQRGDKGVKAKIFAQAGRDAKKQRRGSK
jgi:endonuclease YncB( thermonuclease family)